MNNMAKKADLLDEAKDLGLDVTESNTVAEIQEAIDNFTPENDNVRKLQPQLEELQGDKHQEFDHVKQDAINELSTDYFEYGRLTAQMKSLEMQSNAIQKKWNELAETSNDLYEKIVKTENELQS